MSEAVIEHPATPTLAKSANVRAKGALVLLLVFAVAYPDQANLRDKAAGMRAIGYPLVSFTIPVLWWTLWRDRMSFPWLPDLLITITCFSDTLGDLALGTAGAVVAAVIIHRAWRRGHLVHPHPLR